MSQLATDYKENYNWQFGKTKTLELSLNEWKKAAEDSTNELARILVAIGASPDANQCIKKYQEILAKNLDKPKLI